MIVAAIDISCSTMDVPSYKDRVFDVLSSLPPPIHVFYWSHKVEDYTVFKSIQRQMVVFSANGGTRPKCFMEVLPTKTPIELYIFTDGEIFPDDVRECRAILKLKTIEITKVHLHYIGEEQRMNLRFTDVFDGIHQTVSIQGLFVGSVEAKIPTFDQIDYDYIMKDDSFKATILKLLNMPSTDKNRLKLDLQSLTSRILKNHFKDRLSISKYYDDKDVEGCAMYVKSHSYFSSKAIFQSKMSDILNLFEGTVDTYSLKHLKPVEKFILNCEEPEEEEEEPLECEYLTCDILFGKCNIGCIPVKECKEDLWPDEKDLKFPFKILESTEVRKKIASFVEPYTMDYLKTYKNLTNPDISPFTRQELQGVYILHNKDIDVQDMIKHNNHVLSTFFSNKLPGKPILWHIVFLYILAADKFLHIRDILFDEIRFLGAQDTYFVTLTSTLNPPIVDFINHCFWYIANVCCKAFPCSKKNLLRRKEYITGTFLKFYQDVYDASYNFPDQFPMWQLWFMLCTKELAIFDILTNFYAYKVVDEVESPYNIILFRNRKRPEAKPLKEFEFLKHLDFFQV